MTKISFATDIHRDTRIFEWLELLAKASDVIAIGGDIDDPYSGLPNFKLNFIMHKLRPNSFRDRILRIAETSKTPIITVLGNHDNPGAPAFHGRSIKLGSVTIGGVGGSLPNGPNFPFEIGEEEYRSILSKLGHVDVLVIHQPPFGTKCDVAYHGEHVGSKAVREYIDKERPRLVLTGHIHESPAVDELGGTTIVNPGPFFGGSYAEVELTQDQARATIMDVATRRPMRPKK